MMEIYVLDQNFIPLGVIDSYKSCIWARRYNDVGDCELYLEAISANLSILVKGNYLSRNDDDMLCRINKIELSTSHEEGDFLIINAVDVSSFLNQRVVWGTAYADGNVEDYLRNIVQTTLCDPALSARQLRKADNTRMMYLGNKANFTEVLTEQASYVNVGEKVREMCQKYGWGHKVVLSSNNLYFLLYKGIDRGNEVIFSDEYENLAATSYIEDETNLGNVALIAGEGEGAARTRNVSGYAEGVERYEIYVDARDISKILTWADLTRLYPLHEDGGQGSIQARSAAGGGTYYVYEMDYIDIHIVDDNQYTELVRTYPDGTRITKEGNVYYRVYSADIADLPHREMEDSDNVELRNIVYSVYLLNRGYEYLASYGAVTSFNGVVEPNTTFKYKEDYFLGDKVLIENQYGISVVARIVEVIEVSDENGYSVEPRFEYLDIN